KTLAIVLSRDSGVGRSQHPVNACIDCGTRPRLHAKTKGLTIAQTASIQENHMYTRSSFTMLSLMAISVLAAVAGSEVMRAQATHQPILDAVANKVILTYQQSTCEQLWQKKSAPPSEEQQRVVTLLRGDPQLRAAFINKVAAPIANKMFDCGMIP